jgi:alpha-1,3/alpha-1,6-mannosyltransferase
MSIYVCIDLIVRGRDVQFPGGPFNVLKLIFGQMPHSMTKESTVVAFIHPDLGIGGAERLILDAARAVRTKYDRLTIWTSRYEPTRALSDARDFHASINVRGYWIPRHFLGFFHIFFALFRNLVLTIQCARHSRADIFIVDQISAWLPVLKWLRPNAKIIFYCHFPDLLLSRRDSILRRIYRFPFDFLELKGLRKADRILVNSAFTARTVEPVLQIPGSRLEVLYPCVNCDSTEVCARCDPPLFLSLNRYERKKNHALAIRALSLVKDDTRATLVIAGGCDPEVRENVLHKAELENLAGELGVRERVRFLQNVSDTEKRDLIGKSTAVVYTPANEHFGIVPVEALSLGRPVIACKSGGPCETVNIDECWLCEGTATDFAAAMMEAIGDDPRNYPIREKALRDRARTFGFGNFTERWVALIDQYAA